MSNCAEDFLAAAKTLVEGGQEIDYRNSASRAYYAAFHNCSSVENFCPDNSHLVINAGLHKKLILRFADFPRGQKGYAQAAGIGYMLRVMKASRQDADYELTKDFGVKDAAVLLANAERMFKKTDEFAQLMAG